MVKTMKTAIIAAGIIGSPLQPRDPPQRDLGQIDTSTLIRVFHSDAFVASGGSLDIDMVPVQDGQRNGGAFLMTDAFPSADAPMDAGIGWFLFRDASGNATAVFVDAETSLRDLEEGLEGDGNLDAEFGIAFDAAGAHLVGVLDHKGQALFEQERVDYLPAPSLATTADSVFLVRGGVVWPERGFADDPQSWPIDGDAQWSSAPSDGLWMAESDRIDIIEGALGEPQGWSPFIQLSEPVYGEDGWVLPPSFETSRALDTLTFDRGRFWGQRDVNWRYLDEMGEWQTAIGSVEAAAEAMAVDLAVYGIISRTIRL